MRSVSLVQDLTAEGICGNPELKDEYIAPDSGRMIFTEAQHTALCNECINSGSLAPPGCPGGDPPPLTEDCGFLAPLNRATDDEECTPDIDPKIADLQKLKGGPNCVIYSEPGGGLGTFCGERNSECVALIDDDEKRNTPKCVPRQSLEEVAGGKADGRWGNLQSYVMDSDARGIRVQFVASAWGFLHVAKTLAGVGQNERSLSLWRGANFENQEDLLQILLRRPLIEILYRDLAKGPLLEVLHRDLAKGPLLEEESCTSYRVNTGICVCKVPENNAPGDDVRTACANSVDNLPPSYKDAEAMCKLGAQPFLDEALFPGRENGGRRLQQLTQTEMDLDSQLEDPPRRWDFDGMGRKCL
eukprot:s296_g22.t1